MQPLWCSAKPRTDLFAEQSALCNCPQCGLAQPDLVLTLSSRHWSLWYNVWGQHAANCCPQSACCMFLPWALLKVSVKVKWSHTLEHWHTFHGYTDCLTVSRIRSSKITIQRKLEYYSWFRSKLNARCSDSPLREKWRLPERPLVLIHNLGRWDKRPLLKIPPGSWH